MSLTWTAFITPASKRRFSFLPRLATIALLAATLPWIQACAPDDPSFGIRVSDIEASQRAGKLAINARQNVRLSDDAISALRHGVPLRFRVDLALNPDNGGVERQWFVYEVRYLPLSDHYQLSGPLPGDMPRTFPRLRHALAALGEIDLRLNEPFEDIGPYRLSLRSRLDRSALPGPMQLPAFLSSQWRLDSGWVTEELSAGG